MEKKIILFLTLMIFSRPSVSLGLEKDGPISLVGSFINEMGSDNLEKSLHLKKYFHPDFIALGSEKLDLVVISRKFKILKVYETNDCHNFNHPQKEKYFAVKVSFECLAKLDGDDAIIYKKKYLETFYCSKSTGEYLIVQATDPEMLLKMCFYDSTLNWLEEKSRTEKSFKQALLTLKSIKGKDANH